MREFSASVLNALAVPRFVDLDEERTAGRACVWNGEPLRIETAVDLGEQNGPAGTWFPRASRQVVAERARRAVTAHVPMCPECRAEDQADCALGAELHRLVLVYTPVRYCSQCDRQIAPDEAYTTAQAQSGPGGATTYTHTRPCQRRRR
ncbi:hypothetical protein [Streptomyces griseoviridis]|uniref:hypothetical protein n=1 Tax=Streptomyces griseoviridis TaxID=45398 RepID=UPI00340C2E65